MLAGHLYRLARRKPVRYAAQDALQNLRLAMALRNLVHVNSRADDLPHMAHLGAAQIHPALVGLLQDVHQRHDPRAVGVAADLLTDLGHEPPAPGSINLIAQEDAPQESLINTLHTLHTVLSGRSDYLPHDEIRRRYGNLHDWRAFYIDAQDDDDAAFRKSDMSAAVRNTLDPHEAGVYDLMRHLQTYVRPYLLVHHNGDLGQELYRGLQQGLSGALGVGARLPDLLSLYDALHRTQTHPALLAGNNDAQGAAQTAGHIRRFLAQSMRQTLLPALHEGL